MGLTSGRNLNQTITYWAPGTRNGFNELTFVAPVTIKGRWTEKAEQRRNKDGDVLVTRASIHVNQEVMEAGYLAQGDQTAFADPTTSGLDVHVCAEIIIFEQYPDLRNIDISNVAYI